MILSAEKQVIERKRKSEMQKTTHKIKITASLLSVAMLLFSALAFGGCSRKLESQGMRIIDKKSGSAYSFMPAYLAPAARSKKAYGKATFSGASQELYTINGLDASEWLCTEWGDILYSGTDVINTLADFAPARAYICDTESTVSIALLEIKGDDVDAIRERWMTGDAAAEISAEPSKTYVLRFESDKFPGIYYCISLYEYADKVLLYSKYEGARRVDATDIMEGFLFGDTGSDTTDAG